MKKNSAVNVDKVVEVAYTVFNNCVIDYRLKGSKVNLVVRGVDGSNWGCCTVDSDMSTRKLEQIMRKFKARHRDISNSIVRNFKTMTLDLDLSLIV